MKKRPEKARRTAAKLQNSQKDFEKWAHEQLVPWGPSFSDDIRAFVAAVYPKDAFGLKDEERWQLVNAATVYEYARESRKARGLAVMMHRILKRVRLRIAELEKHRESERNQRGTKSKLSVSEEDYLVPVFEGVEPAQLEDTLGAWAGFLGEVGDLLAKNVSFKMAWEKDRKRITDSLWTIIKTKKGPVQIFRFSGNYYREIPPIEPALGWSPDKVSDCWSFVAAPRPRAAGAAADQSREANERLRRHGWARRSVDERHGLTDPGVEYVVFRINWNRRKDEICDSFGRFVSRHRPPGLRKPASKKRESQPQKWVARLRNLAAMREVAALSPTKLEINYPERPNKRQAAAKRARELLKKFFHRETSFEHAATFASRTQATMPQKKRPRG